MPYAVLADLIERAGETEILEIADRDDDGTADPDVIAAALKSGDDTINLYVGARYRLPFNPVPDMVKTYAVSIARYHLHRQGQPDYVVRDYNLAIAALKDIARGVIVLSGADGLEPAAGDTGSVLVTGPEPSFSADKLGGWL